MIDPHGLTARQWFDAVISDSKSSWTFGRFEGDWRDYALGFVRAFGTPDPYQFSDWRDWAMRAALMLETRNG